MTHAATPVFLVERSRKPAGTAHARCGPTGASLLAVGVERVVGHVLFNFRKPIAQPGLGCSAVPGLPSS
jgi:hypothetical protein